MSIFSVYLRAVAREMINHPYYRPGQAYFNVLVSYDRELAENIRGSENDPFYNDSSLSGFLEIVEMTWALAPPRNVKSSI